jgi:hypothetical protein
MPGERCKEIDRNIRRRILDLPDIVPANASKVTQLLLSETSIQSGCPQVRAKHVPQCNIHMKRRRPAALCGHARVQVHHWCIDSIACGIVDTQWRLPSMSLRWARVIHTAKFRFSLSSNSERNSRSESMRYMPRFLANGRIPPTKRARQFLPNGRRSPTKRAAHRYRSSISGFSTRVPYQTGVGREGRRWPQR